MLYSLGDKRITTPRSGQFWVAPSATVVGEVVLGEESSVWFGAVLRADNEPIVVGDRSNIQDGAVLHTDPGFPLRIASDCTIGHIAMLHGCTIGRGTLVGIGAVVLNGAVIGEDCLIGARALVGEGKVIPPRSLVVGIPGKVMRELSDAEVDRMHRGVATYQANWRRFKGCLEADAPSTQ